MDKYLSFSYSQASGNLTLLKDTKEKYPRIHSSVLQTIKISIFARKIHCQLALTVFIYVHTCFAYISWHILLFSMQSSSSVERWLFAVFHCQCKLLLWRKWLCSLVVLLWFGSWTVVGHLGLPLMFCVWHCQFQHE